jgi:hypothetical protein
MKRILMIILIFSSLSFINCTDNDTTTLTKFSVNGAVLFKDGDDFFGDIDGDFTSKGGSASRVFFWHNSLQRADYNADITATAKGTFRMIVKDANGVVVLDKSLVGATDPDSISGVTSIGVAGIWSVTITVNSFNGDGSFSLSEGD